MLLVAQLSGDSIRIPRALVGHGRVLALSTSPAWNGLILFGVQQMPAGRSAILAYTMPIWTVLISLVVLHEPLSRRKIVGLVLGMLRHGGAARRRRPHIARAPIGTLLILGAAIVWAIGTVLLRKWKPPLPQTTLTGWMMLLGWVPIALAAPLFDPQPLRSLATMSGTGWFAVLYNIFSRRHARALDVVHAGAHAAGGGDLAVVAAGAGGRRVLRHAVPGRAAGSERMSRARAGARLAGGGDRSRRRRAKRRMSPPESRSVRLLGRAPTASSGISVSTPLAREPRVEVGLAQVAHRLARLARRAADVRQQHDVVHRQQLGRNVRLVGEHVEPGTLDRARLERRDQRRLVDDRAARDVDERAFLAQRREHVAR